MRLHFPFAKIGGAQPSVLQRASGRGRAPRPPARVTGDGHPRAGQVTGTAIGILLLALGLAACRGDGPSPEVATVVPTSATTVPATGAGASEVGGIEPGTPLTSAQMKVQLAYVRCMRSHGLPDFPDPMSTGGFPPGSIPKHSPNFNSAMTACRGSAVAAGMFQAKRQSTQQQTAAMLRYAQCMRRHGEPKFPDPSNGVFDLPSDVDPTSAQFGAANRACSGLLGG